jgi:hypothetical protein
VTCERARAYERVRARGPEEWKTIKRLECALIILLTVVAVLWGFMLGISIEPDPKKWIKIEPGYSYVRVPATREAP